MSLGRNCVFASVMCFVLPMCILISCMYVVCVDGHGHGYVYVYECYVVLDECHAPSFYLCSMYVRTPV